MNIKKEIVFKERSQLGRIFLSVLEGESVTPNFHLYSVDARGENSLEDVVLRIDRLMENVAIKAKEDVYLPLIFKDAVHNLKTQDRLQNITAHINPLYKMNYMTGKRKVESEMIPGYYHNISWVAIILSKVIHDMGLVPGVLDFELKNIKQFMEGMVPKDESSFTMRMNLIKEDQDFTELNQYLSIAKKIRPELYEKYSMFDRLEKKGLTTDIMDYVDTLDDFAELENGNHD